MNTFSLPPLEEKLGELIHLEDWRRRMIVERDVRAAMELAYELAQQIASIEVALAFPATAQSLGEGGDVVVGGEASLVEQVR